jgi:nucleoid-associated protein EbfC
MPGVDLNYFIRQANKLTEKIEQRKKELADETIEGRAGDGRVVVTANGVQEIRGIKIDPAAIDPQDPSMLEDLITRP